MPPAADGVSTAHDNRYNKSPVYASEPIQRHGVSKVQQFRHPAAWKHPAATRAGEARGYLPHTILENFVRSLPQVDICHRCSHLACVVLCSVYDGSMCREQLIQQPEQEQHWPRFAISFLCRRMHGPLFQVWYYHGEECVCARCEDVSVFQRAQAGPGPPGSPRYLPGPKVGQFGSNETELASCLHHGPGPGPWSLGHRPRAPGPWPRLPPRVTATAGMNMGALQAHAGERLLASLERPPCGGPTHIRQELPFSMGTHRPPGRVSSITHATTRTTTVANGNPGTVTNGTTDKNGNSGKRDQ